MGTYGFYVKFIVDCKRSLSQAVLFKKKSMNLYSIKAYIFCIYLILESIYLVK